LYEKETTYRLKSRALRLEKCDEIKNFFHQYANHRKNINTVWNVKGLDGSLIFSFNHFNEIFKENERVTIAEVVRMTTFFPSFVFEDDNISLMEFMSKKELLKLLHSF
jgi:hypothetical protein